MTQQSPPPSPVRLPGVGARLDLTDQDGHPLEAVRRKDGVVELHHRGSVIVIEPDTAGSLGAFVTGHFILPSEVARRTAHVVGGLAFDWVHLSPSSHAVGHTIESLAVRRRTGVTIVAILRGSQPLVVPDPNVRLEAGDDLVVACREEDRAAFERYMEVGR